jgi:hypothetical protein
MAKKNRHTPVKGIEVRKFPLEKRVFHRLSIPPTIPHPEQKAWVRILIMPKLGPPDGKIP